MTKHLPTFLVVLIGCTFLFSCDENSTLVETYYSDVNSLTLEQTQKRRPEISYSTLDTIEEYGTMSIYRYTGYGFDTSETVEAGQKRVFSSAMLTELGLSNGYYIVDILKLTKKLSCPKGLKIVPRTYSEDSDIYSQTGTKTKEVFSSSAVRGFNANPEKDEDNLGYFHGETYIAHIRCDISGISVNKYYPCSPTDLVWYYSAIEEEDDSGW